MRDLNFEAAVWNLFTAPEFFESASHECEKTMAWFGHLAVEKGVVDYGRNSQIYDTFKKYALEFKRGADLARFGDYMFVRGVASSVSGDVRGIMEQRLHAWMTKAEYAEFEDVKISRLMAFAREIMRALHNALFGADVFDNTDPEFQDLKDLDQGFPADEILESYESDLSYLGTDIFPALPSPLPPYVIDRSIECHTGDEVPRTGVWCPATGLEGHGLTFAIQGLRMPPAYRVTKTVEELKRETGEYVYGGPETVAIATAWHPVIPAVSADEPKQDLFAKARQPCPKTGIWQPTDPGASERRYQAGEPMADLKSAYGYTVWRWIAD